MIYYPISDNGLRVSIATIFMVPIAKLELGKNVLLIHGNTMTLLCWFNGRTTYRRFFTKLNTLDEEKVLDECIDTVDEAIIRYADLAGAGHIWCPGKNGPIACVDYDGKFSLENNKRIAWFRLVPLFQMFINDRVDGEDCIKSLNALYGTVLPVKVVRVFLNGGIIIKSKEESSDSDFLELATHLLTLTSHSA